MSDLLRSLVAPVAKAIAAGLMPVLVVVAAWLVDNLGLEVSFDVSAVETVVVAVLTAAVTYLVPNKADDPTDG